MARTGNQVKGTGAPKRPARQGVRSSGPFAARGRHGEASFPKPVDGVLMRPKPRHAIGIYVRGSALDRPLDRGRTTFVEADGFAGHLPPSRTEPAKPRRRSPDPGAGRHARSLRQSPAWCGSTPTPLRSCAATRSSRARFGSGAVRGSIRALQATGISLLESSGSDWRDWGIGDGGMSLGRWWARAAEFSVPSWPDLFQPPSEIWASPAIAQVPGSSPGDDGTARLRSPDR